MQLALGQREATAQRWRLPHVADLRRLANRLAKVPELVPTLFPQSPRDLCWSATSVIDESAVNPYNYGNIQRGRTRQHGATALSARLGHGSAGARRIPRGSQAQPSPGAAGAPLDALIPCRA
jgi:hypothetical protein